MKDRVLAILGVYGVYDPTVVTNPSRLQTIARHLKDEMDDAKAARRAALDAERLRQEARQRQNVRQEGALGAIPQGYGVDAPRVAGANEEMQRHFQQAADLLAQNPRSQNNRCSQGAASYWRQKRLREDGHHTHSCSWCRPKG